VLNTSWRNYGMTQSRGALPAGPMVIFVHMASVWVPFTSESKEAIADYDEIQKEIRLALREAGRRLGIFLRRKERAAGEFRRRNIFDLYIEEVVEACNRLKGGKLPTEQLKEQLHTIASTRTGGLKTDEALGKTGAGPEGLPHSIIVTTEGIEGEAEVAQHAALAPVIAGIAAPSDQRLVAKAPVKAEPTTRKKPARKKTKPATAEKGKAGQQDLFVEPASSVKKAVPPKRRPTATRTLRKGK
jgi:DNA topoisomerase-6 subunit B